MAANKLTPWEKRNYILERAVKIRNDRQYMTKGSVVRVWK